MQVPYIRALSKPTTNSDQVLIRHCFSYDIVISGKTGIYKYQLYKEHVINAISYLHTSYY